MPWSSGYCPSVSWDANITSTNTSPFVNPAAFDPSAWPAHAMKDGLDLPTFDLYVKCVFVSGATTPGLLGVPEQQVSVGQGRSFKVLRNSSSATRKRAGQVEFQGTPRVPYDRLMPFIRELLVLHHPHLQRKKIVIGLLGFAWDIELGSSDMFTVASPSLVMEFAQHGNMAEYLKTRPLSKSLSERKMLCHQILAGLSCLHGCYIVHGDLKLENVLVCSSEAGSGVVAKLSDFGFSLFVNGVDPTPVNLPGGSEFWNSPEWRDSQPPTEFYKSDMYSAGLLIWASFSLGEDPFNWEGQNSFAEPVTLPSDSRDQWLCKIENLKKSDTLLGVACRTTKATLIGIDKGSRSLNIRQSLLTIVSERSLFPALKIVFENTLQLNSTLRSLQPAIKALATDAPPLSKEDDDQLPNWWGALSFSPLLVSVKSFQLGQLRGGYYSMTPGAPVVARLSVAISKAIFDNTKVDIERRRDAAFFLFRSYFENYGVEENQNNAKQATHWLHEFVKLGMISGAEDLCFAVAEISERIGYILPPDFPLESCLRNGLQSVFKGGMYIKSVVEERIQSFPKLFNELFSSFKEDGLRRLLPQPLRSSDLSTILPIIGSDNHMAEAVAYLHIAASCGDIQTAELLVTQHGIDPNARTNYQDFTPLFTALRFSQTEFVLWLLRKGVSATLGEQRFPVLQFLCNFGIDDATAICNALCQGGASVNDSSYLFYRFVFMNILSLATLAFDLATIDLLLAQQPTVATCKNAFQWACAHGRLDVIVKLESYLTKVLDSSPSKSDWELGLSSITLMSPYNKITFPFKPNLSETAKYIIDKIGEDLTPESLLKWMKMAIIVGDSESLHLCLTQAGSAQFLRRTKPLGGKQEQFLEKSALEWAVVFDRKEMFDILVAKGSPIELEQAEGNFPTLLHSAAQRDALNEDYFCNLVLAKGGNLEARSSKKLRGVTAFEVAVRYNNYKVADLLLRQGACIDGFNNEAPTPLGELINVHSRDALRGIKFLLNHPKGKPSFIVDREEGRTALHLACGPDYDHDWQYLEDIDGHKAILDILLEHYNKPNDLNARDKRGFTALHHAAYRGCDWAVAKLLNAGADPNLYSSRCMRPLDCARKSPFTSIALRAASPNFILSSPNSEIRRAAAMVQCLELLTTAGGLGLEDAGFELGMKKYMLGAFGLINTAKEDHEVYEPWMGEFPLSSMTKWLASRRNKKSRAQIIA